MEKQIELLLYFESNDEITEHLWRMAWAYSGSDYFDELPPEEKKEWLFKQCQLVDFFRTLQV